MGNCLGADVSSKYEVAGQAAAADSQRAHEAEAEEMLTGSLAYCTWMMIHLECRKLKDADMFSKSDPMGVLFERKDDRWVEAGRTELIANNTNPSFVTRFRVLYNFEKIQKYKIMVVDVDKGEDPRTINPDKCDFLGLCEFELSEVVTAPGKKLARQLSKKDGMHTQSTAVLIGEEASNSKDVFKIKFAASKLKNVEMIGKSDPFLQISRLQEDGQTWLPVFKTGVKSNNLNPVWDEIVVRATQLNNGDMMRPLRLQVYDYEASGKHRMLGQTELSTERMQELAAQHGAIVPLGPPPGKPSGDYGSLQVMSFMVQQRSTFVDYLAGGLEIGFIVAVDFTASNGDPRSAGSKHFFSAGPTQYEQAIMGIGHVIEHYDHDKMFPVYGFGGQLGRNPTQHCFNMGSGPESTCAGINGVLAAYRQALSTWTLSGPTLFAPVIRMAAQQARATVAARPPKYTCLLILTDGAIMDMNDTINAIIDATTLPLSILIVGIGNDNFGDMNRLDGDKQRLSVGNRTAVRDIVQFVEFNRYAGDAQRLAQELLAELPGQLLEYMRNNNINAPPPLTAAPTMATPPPVHGAPAAPPPPAAYGQPGAPPPGPSPAPGPYPVSSDPNGYPGASAPPPPPGYPLPGAPPGAPGYPQPGGPPPPGYPQPGGAPPPGAYPQPGATQPPAGYPQPGATPPPGAYPQPGAAPPPPGYPTQAPSTGGGYPGLAAPVGFNRAPQGP
ncbi:hypothetical protein HYH03_002927 [Edaphochlamys debaryana]|uniref:C2 domain-containing protein n=1 Tax=Edaphochlamys debaryana TaxID=47281 RepID=A0A835YAI8_9CHLO|nr:hypothetical protein HYH03_002927 [Edaphochlamys debaryana]|eukprot:KAG2499352.1 hypothetical protein HYH03_002927 [Edaphochlamys debaryana]